ncbi:MAG: DUF2752 domain-containing protein [Bacteroidota bacterium]
MLVIPIVLWGLPASFFDKGQSLCLSVLLLDNTCYGCGITRAVQHCIHGEFLIGYQYNPLVVIVLPLLIYIWIKLIIFNFKSIINLKK